MTRAQAILERVDPFWGKRGLARNAPTISREPQQSCEPGDRPELLHQDKTNKTAPLGRDRAAPSSLASIANRMTTTESPFLKTINDFCNKICHNRTHAPQHKAVLNHRVSKREQIVYRLYKSPSPYSDQRALTRASSSGDGRTVGGKRSPPHSGRQGFFHERVASISIRFQSPVPS
jgi:hypothetical protein